MATLTLKKPTLVGDTPLEKLSEKFVVMRQSRNVKSFRFTCFHETQELALREAKRLSKSSKSERFLVLEIKCWSDWEA